MKNIISITLENDREYWLPLTKDGLETLQARYKDEDQSIVNTSIVRPNCINEKKWILVRYETESLFFYPFSDQTLTILFEEQDIIDDFYILEVNHTDGMDQRAVYVEYQGVHSLLPYSAETIEKLCGDLEIISGIQVIDRGDVTKQLKLFGGV